MRVISDAPHLENVPVLVRGALNVPIEAGKVGNAYRLRRALPTLELLTKRHAKVILVSHLGEKGTETLAPVALELGRLMHGVTFCPLTTGPAVREAIRTLTPGKVLVLENVRRNRGEVMNDSAFAHELAALADIFVEDSFDTCHRKHASIVGVPKLLPAYAGLLLEEEVSELTKALTPQGPSFAVIGGAKFETKEPVLATLLQRYDRVFVGGALVNDLLKAAGHEVGQSLVSPEPPAHIDHILANPRLVLPVDVVVVPANAAAPSPAQARVAKVTDVQPDERILDIGPSTSAILAQIAAGAKSTLWNGPLGNYEHGFSDATDSLARAIAGSHSHSVVGGGDTIAAIEKLQIFSHFSFVSTGGGAMLDYLAYGTLPGIAALEG